MTASTGRQDYDQTVKLSSLQAGEPIFVIRGRDAVGGDAVRAWAGLAHRAGAPAEAIELALQQADRLDAWPDRKTPDGPDLAEAERKQLRYEHGRRAWSARMRVATDTEALAAQLGVDAVVARLRSLLAPMTAAMAGDGGRCPEGMGEIYALAGWDLERRLQEARGS